MQAGGKGVKYNWDLEIGLAMHSDKANGLLDKRVQSGAGEGGVLWGEQWQKLSWETRHAMFLGGVATFNMQAYEFKRVGAKDLFGVFSPATEENKRGTRLYCDSVLVYYLGYADILFNLAQQTDDLQQKVNFLQEAEQKLQAVEGADTARTLSVINTQQTTKIQAALAAAQAQLSASPVGAQGQHPVAANDCYRTGGNFFTTLKNSKLFLWCCCGGDNTATHQRLDEAVDVDQQQHTKMPT